MGINEELRLVEPERLTAAFEMELEHSPAHAEDTIEMIGKVYAIPAFNTALSFLRTRFEEMVEEAFMTPEEADARIVGTLTTFLALIRYGESETLRGDFPDLSSSS